MEQEQEVMKDLQHDEGSKAIGFKVTELPTAILSEILSKLSFNDTLRCRATCKTFRSVTMDPHFIDSQITKNKQSPAFLIEITNSEALYLTIPNSSSISKIVQLPISDIVASCNGLLIGTTEEKGLFVLNPITNEYLKLSSYLDPLEEYPHTLRIGFGFGYDQVNKKYKVVVVYSNDLIKSKCKILSLGESSWRESGFPYRINTDDKPVFLNGAFHWLIGGRKRRYSDFDNILVLDINTEGFQTMGFPSYPQGHLNISEDEYEPTKYSLSTKLSLHYKCQFKLVDFGGSLAIVSIKGGGSMKFTVEKNIPMIHIWQIMDNQNNDRCLYSHFFHYQLFDDFFIGREVLEMLSDGRFLIRANRCNRNYEHNPYLALYDPKRMVGDTVDVRGAPELCSAVSFVPSLLSPSAL